MLLKTYKTLTAPKVTAAILMLGLCCALCPLATAQQSDSATPVLHIGTRVVAVDVVVTDDAGKPVHSLPASAFHVYEDGHPERILDFADHHFQPTPPTPLPPLGPGEFTNAIPHRYGNMLTVVVLDTMNTRMQDQMYVHQQVENYLLHARPGAQIALLEITSHLILLQSFTSDPRILLAALKNAGSFAVSPLLHSGGSSGEGGRGGVGGGGGRGMGGGEGNIAEVRSRLRDDYTADSFQELSRYLSQIPGEKNVIYFSDGNSRDFGPDGVDGESSAGVFDTSPLFDQASYLVSDSQTSFTFIDAHGLATNGAFSAENGKLTTGSIASGNGRIANRTLYDEEFAEEMGGQAFLNSNNLAGEMGEAIITGSNYYSFNYHPRGDRMDGEYHSIRITLDDPAYHLAYRNGYKATLPKRGKDALESTDANTPEQETAVRARTPIGNSMQRGWPEMNQILYRERFVPLGNKKGGSETDQLAPGSTKDPKMKAKFRNFNLIFTVDTSNIRTTTLPNGKVRMKVEFLVLTYNDQNLLRTAVSKELDGDISFADLTQLRKTGLRFSMPFSAPASGNFYVRTGVHDMTSNSIGTLEVPKSLLENLPPQNPAAKKQ